MRYVELLLEDENYRKCMQKIQQLEVNRIYCRHDFSHCMDVARLACLYAQEHNLTVDQEQVYLAACLHDIGRVEEYHSGISHAEASVAMAGEILLRLAYDEQKTEEILYAIGKHRGDRAEVRGSILADLLYRADHASRPCFLCAAADTCKWDIKRRNTPANWR